jgi:glycosyltransferase involved in cell wall biosynthesis
MKTHVLFISSKSSLEGGGQRSTFLILKYLDKQKYLPILLVPEEGEFSQKVRNELGLEVVTLSFPPLRVFTCWRNIKAVMRLKKIIQTHHIRLVHVESPRQAIVAGLAKLLCKFALITHLRVSNSSFLTDLVLSLCSNQIIAVSEEARGRLGWLVHFAKTAVVYNGVDPARFINNSPAPREPFVFAYCGRIDPRKGIDILIQAFKQLSVPCTLWIVGSGDAGALNQLKALAAGTFIRFLPYQPDIAPSLAKVSAVVLPSLFGEGLSRIVLESMAASRLVVVSDLKSNREALGDLADKYSFPTGDIHDLSKKMKMVVEQFDTLQKDANLLQERAKRLFNAAKNVCEIEKIYEKTLMTFMHI